jgi:hypothetical protein
MHTGSAYIQASSFRANRTGKNYGKIKISYKILKTGIILTKLAFRFSLKENLSSLEPDFSARKLNIYILFPST